MEKWYNEPITLDPFNLFLTQDEIEEKLSEKQNKQVCYLLNGKEIS